MVFRVSYEIHRITDELIWPEASRNERQALPHPFWVTAKASLLWTKSSMRSEFNLYLVLFIIVALATQHSINIC